MYTIQDVKASYKDMKVRIEAFVNSCGGVEYVEGSQEVVNEGMFAWRELEDSMKQQQALLVEDYSDLTRAMRALVSDRDEVHLEEFDKSCNTVLAYIRQDSFIWESRLDEVIESIRKELIIQAFLVTQTENVKE